MTAETIDELVSLINETYFTNLIISGRFAKVVLPHMHHLEHLRSIIIFCGSEKVYKPWVADNNFNKVVLVTSSLNAAITECFKQSTLSIIK